MKKKKKIKKVILGVLGYGIEFDLDDLPLFKRKYKETTFAGKKIKIPYKRFEDRLQIDVDYFLF